MTVSIEEVKGIAMEALQRAVKAENTIATHEAVCSERYGGISRDLKNLTRATQSLNNRVVLFLVFVITTLMGASGYLYIRTQDRFTGTDATQMMQEILKSQQNNKN